MVVIAVIVAFCVWSIVYLMFLDPSVLVFMRFQLSWCIWVLFFSVIFWMDDLCSFGFYRFCEFTSCWEIFFCEELAVVIQWLNVVQLSWKLFELFYHFRICYCIISCWFFSIKMIGFLLVCFPDKVGIFLLRTLIYSNWA